MRRALVIAVGVAMCRAAAAAPADDAFQSGLALMEKADYAAACAAFELSQRLDPQYGTELNLAVCYVRIRKLYAAWKLYSEVARADRNAARAARAARAAEELWPRVPTLRLRVPARAPGVRVAVDAADATALVDSDMPVELGRHAIEASSPAARPFRREVELAPGDHREVDIVFEREPAAVALAPAARAAEAPGPSHGWAWGALGAGAALVGGGVVAGWNAHRLDDDAHATCRPGACADPTAAQHQVDRARRWGDAATILIATGAVALAGGVYLWRTARAQPLRIDAAVGPSSTAVVIRGAF